MNKLSHVAFIMDGNGRWGKKAKRGRNYGHLKGVETVKKVVEGSIRLKIKHLTFYVFSTENWKRPKSEIEYLFKLIFLYFTKELKHVIKNGIKISIIGNINPLPSKLKKLLKTVEKKTNKNKMINVNLALNYGSRDEIIRTIKKIKKVNKITEKAITSNLFTKNVPDPEILVRTGGRKRLSNFMLWQLAYTEIFFLDKLWPDFKISDLRKIINKYKNTKRNFGSLW